MSESIQFFMMIVKFSRQVFPFLDRSECFYLRTTIKSPDIKYRDTFLRWLSCIIHHTLGRVWQNSFVSGKVEINEENRMQYVANKEMSSFDLPLKIRDLGPQSTHFPGGPTLGKASNNWRSTSIDWHCKYCARIHTFINIIKSQHVFSTI